MNRIQITSLATAPPPKKVDKPSLPLPGTFKAPSGQPTVFVPLHYESNYAYPLIVWLHSTGDDPGQLLRVMPSVSLRNYLGVAPKSSVGDRFHGYSWEQSPRGIDNGRRAVSEAIDYARKKFSVANDRIIIAGHGSGGTMALRIAFELADQVAGAASINGPIPSGQTPFSNWPGCRKTPLFWAHCRRSVSFTESQLCDQLRLLHLAGFLVTLRQYPLGDEIPAQAFPDLNKWIMGQIETAVL